MNHLKNSLKNGRMIRCLLGAMGVWAFLLLVCKTEPEDSLPEGYSEIREPCTQREPLRVALFGDLHVHTAYSFDARGYDTVVSPAEALAFAKGQAVHLPPLNDAGKGTRKVQLQRPLDFAALTDHSEFLGEIWHCTTPSASGYSSETCKQYRDPAVNGASFFGLALSLPSPSRPADVCGEDGEACEEGALLRWKSIRDAVEEAYDKTASCGFTAFAAYEYSNTRDVANLHRNVIFRNDQVPERPVTYYDASTPARLWQSLDEKCNSTDSKCDVMVIPHNSNLSNGRLYSPAYQKLEAVDDQITQAKLRARMEPLVEMFQHKGDSECRNGFSSSDGNVVAEDAHCDFEKQRPAGAEICDETLGGGGMRLQGCVHPLDFVRNVLKFGLQEEKRIGVNPYRLGVIGSTDTHNGIPGMVRSVDYPGHIGLVDDTVEKRLGGGDTETHDTEINNPGGLAVVWAEENSRDAIFEALRRRETYATSGPRIEVRLFGGWDYDEALCGQEDFVKEGYEKGVPMGGVLKDLGSARADSKAPQFLLQAKWDEGSAIEVGVGLRQLQIIKGWIDAEGHTREKVYHVGGKESAADSSLDTKTCKGGNVGEKNLCTRWIDPDFDPQRRAFYYARVLQEPSCRWSTYQCNSFAQEDRPAICDGDELAKTVQHRAWTSPIWYQPAGSDN
jgi:hypothetical protein